MAMYIGYMGVYVLYFSLSIAKVIFLLLLLYY